MAWYALHKWFSPWRKLPYHNMIILYSNYLYDQWYESLSDEDKELLRRSQERKRKMHEAKMRDLMMEFLTIGSFYDSHYTKPKRR